MRYNKHPMPMTPDQRTAYLRQARAEDGMQTAEPDDPIVGQLFVTGRRRVGNRLDIQGPTPISSIVQKDGVLAFNERLGTLNIHPISEEINPEDFPQLGITQARRSASDPETRDALKLPRSHRTVGYTRQSRLTPKRKR